MERVTIQEGKLVGNASSGEIFMHFINSIANIYIIPSIALVGIIFNIVFIAGFKSISKANTSNQRLFDYLGIKAICDVISFLIVVEYPIYYCTNCKINKSYYVQLWYIILNKHVRDGMLLSSGMFDVAATLDCAISIHKKLKFWQTRIGFTITSITILLIPAIFYIHFLWFFKVKEMKSAYTLNYTNKTFQRNSSYFVVSKPSFYNTNAGKYLRLLHSFLRDILVPFCLLIINIYILLILRRLRKKKAVLQKSGSSSTSNNNNIGLTASKSQSLRAENRKVKMIVAIGVNYFIGHLMIIIYYFTLNDGGLFWFFIHSVGDIFFYISYITPFFIYYYGNNHFKNYINRRIFHMKRRRLHAETVLVGTFS
jgi:hypothetical protein